MIAQCAHFTIQDDACYCCEEDPLGPGHLVFAQDKDAAAFAKPVLTVRPVEKAINFSLEILVITGRAAVENGQVYFQAAPAPVAVCAQ